MFSGPLVSDAGAPATSLPRTTIDGKSFIHTAWSPDGSRLAGALRAENGRPSGVGISPDHRTIYYGAARAEADIWIMERK